MNVMVIMGSPSDEKAMLKVMPVFDKLGITYEVRIASAHRAPVFVDDIVINATKAGVSVFICGAGMAAHLAGVVASKTTLPVIGVPLSSESSPLNGLDALYATVQMPPGMPVATVAIDRADNAAWLAAQILSIVDESLQAKLLSAREEAVEKIKKADKELQQKMDSSQKESK